MSNPLGDRVEIKEDLVQRFDKISDRVGKMIVGEHDSNLEETLFALLVFAQEGMYFSKKDGLGLEKV